MKFLNDNNYEVAKSFFKPLTNKEYSRYQDVCFHLTRCHFFLDEFPDSLKYLEEAERLITDKSKLNGLWNFIYKELADGFIKNGDMELLDKLCQIISNSEKLKEIAPPQDFTALIERLGCNDHKQ